MKVSVPKVGIDSRSNGPARAGRWASGAAVAPCRRSHSGRALRTGGRVAKLYAGGGDDVAHSSVQASQGFGPATAPRRRLRQAFQRKASTDSASTNEPTVSTRFQVPQPGRSG